MHYSFEKAVALAGLGTDNLVKVPVDHRHRIDICALESCLTELRLERRKPIALIGVAGTTDCGSIDPLRELGKVAAREGVHFHVDAAWGGPLVFSSEHRNLVDGIELADSVTLDGHKQMRLPLGTSMLLFRDPAVAGVIEKRSTYMLQEGSGDSGCFSLEGSREAAGLFLHAALAIVGRSGYGQLVDANLLTARQMAEAIRRRPDFQLLLEPQTNIVLYRFVPAEFRADRDALDARATRKVNLLNEWLQQLQFEAGKTLVSRTTIKNPFPGGGMPTVALRAVVANPSTTATHIDALLEEQSRLGGSIMLTEEFASRSLSRGELRPEAATPRL
jgi:glutamate decarboxylase